MAAPRGVPADPNASCARDFAHCNDSQCLHQYNALGCTIYTKPCVPPCNAWASSNSGGVCDQPSAQTAGRWFAGSPAWSLQVSLADSPTDMPLHCCLDT